LGDAVSISTLLDLSDEEDAPQLGAERPAAVSSDALAFGQTTHRLFEHWDFASGAEPPVDRVLREMRPGPARRRDWSNRLPEIAARFRNSELFVFLAADRNIRKELPFVLREGTLTVNGVLDVLCSDGTIVDYKTGTVNPRKRERYENQMRVYGYAVHRLLNIPVSKAILYYVESGEAHEVPLTPEDCETAFVRVMECYHAVAPG
jgi:ATP-dependent exoDNAse (exonuclease V) beta subunit